ncbi:unnamed protein product [Phytophthora fragariaefolia]|uniref:Unnamed protein product n=1 Tax=Phytophthora fragariaefolia TaxID=1490495 RepID=A0A9W7CX13_9STRA|nr:unnamed protein product [Phytophthora fragariaefolia]
MDVGQPLPKPAGLLRIYICAAAVVDSEKKKADDPGISVFLARWDGFGYTTAGQSKTMGRVMDARDAMRKVGETFEWITEMKMPSSGVVSPFDDCLSVPKLGFLLPVSHFSTGYAGFV